VGGGEQNHYLPGIGSWVGSDFKEPRRPAMPYKQGEAVWSTVAYWIVALKRAQRPCDAMKLKESYKKDPSRVRVVYSFDEPGPDWNRLVVDETVWLTEKDF